MWYRISEHKNITWDIIQANPYRLWNWFMVSKNPNITWDIIQANPEKPWNWHMVSQNPNITLEIIQANPYRPWDWDAVSLNPNINMYTIKENPNLPWTFSIMRSPDVNNCKETLNYIRMELQKWFSKSDLKQELMATVWHPRNIHRFKYLDPDTFASEEEEGEGEEESDW
jgi:hypothetical protein